MNALLREIRTLPHIKGRLAVRVLADELSDGFCLFRSDASPMVDVAVVYDGSDRAHGEAEGYARLLSIAPVMLDLLTGVLARWGEAVEEDSENNDGDVMEWLAKFTVDARKVLQAIVGAVRPGSAP
ncbi:MAG: hypothetical protein ACRYG8_04570 [Janthinobacterium lividum]